jgi:hypothetical protein
MSYGEEDTCGQHHVAQLLPFGITLRRQNDVITLFQLAQAHGQLYICMHICIYIHTYKFVRVCVCVCVRVCVAPLFQLRIPLNPLNSTAGIT